MSEPRDALQPAPSNGANTTETVDDVPPARLRDTEPDLPAVSDGLPLVTAFDGPRVAPIVLERKPAVYPPPSSRSAPSQQRTAEDTGRASGRSSDESGRAPDGTLDPARRSLALAAEPTSIGRYTVLRRLGAGAMGVVYAAYDQELDRKVAIKIVKPRSRPTRDQDLRVLREAQALAKLSHPNVVQIYEVGEFRDQTFLAMEFVQGSTLRDWLAERPRRWQEIVSIVVAAGRGLAAAHHAGLIHRDFKPDNLIVGVDGRPRVLDFGLVRGDALELPPGEDEPSEAGAIAHWQHFRLTRSGVIIGTPAYMSPEQLAGKPADARSDQFNFCATLYEALYGHRPFRGKSVEELRDAHEQRALVPAPRSTLVPQWVHRALLRGLSQQPADRWPTIDALLDALARDPRRTWARVGALAGALAVAGGASYSAAAYQHAEARMCSGAVDELADAWTAARRDAVRAGFSAAGPLAAASVERVVERLDAYADAWTAMRTEACETHRRAEQSDALYDLRVRCLRDRRLGLQATVDLLEKPDATIVEKAVDLVAGLKPLATCADPDALAAAVPPPEDPRTAAAVAELEDRLPAVQAQTLAGQYDAALAASDDLLRRAEALGYAPLLARVALARGNVEMEQTRPDAAVQDFERGAALALEHGLADVAAEALAKQIFIEGTLQAKFDRALALASMAGALARRAPEPLRARALLHNNLGTVHGSRHEHDLALAEYQQAAELWARVPGAEADLFRTLNNIGIAFSEAGRPAEGRAPLERALELSSRIYGPDHPQTLVAKVNLALHFHQARDYRGALTLLDEVLPRIRATVGENHQTTASALYWSGLARRDLGDPQNALRDFTGAKEAYRAAGETSVLAGIVFVELGRTQNMLAHPVEAIDACNGAEAMFRELPPESPFHAARALCLAEATFLQNDFGHTHELVLEAWPHLDALPPELRGLARYLLARTSAQLGNRPAAEIRALATAATEDMRVLDFYYPQREALAAWLATLP